MTQQAPTTTFDVNNQPVPQPAQPAVITLEDRILIASELGATVAEARELRNKLRFYAKIMFSDTQTWEVGRPVPGNAAGLMVYAAFNVDFMSADTEGLDYLPGDCRFYVTPPPDTAVDPLSADFLCYTLNRSSGITNAERMTLETFVREVGREWFNLAVVQGVVIEEDEDDEES